MQVKIWHLAYTVYFIVFFVNMSAFTSNYTLRAFNLPIDHRLQYDYFFGKQREPLLWSLTEKFITTHGIHIWLCMYVYMCVLCMYHTFTCIEFEQVTPCINWNGHHSEKKGHENASRFEDEWKKTGLHMLVRTGCIINSWQEKMREFHFDIATPFINML